MNTWFTVKVKYSKTLENGSFKRVTEPYLLAADSFTDAEARVYEEVIEYIKNEASVVGIARTEFHDIFHYEDSSHWFKVKIVFETTEMDSDKVKKVTQNFLISANNVNEAYERIRENLKTLMIEFSVTNVDLSPIIDVFPPRDNSERTQVKSSLEEVSQDFEEHPKSPNVWSAPDDSEEELEVENDFQDQFEEN